jgi:hypothetical protein
MIGTDAPPAAAAATYQAWGWPVTLRGDQVWLGLDRSVVALLVPVRLAGREIDLAAALRTALRDSSAPPTDGA